MNINATLAEIKRDLAERGLSEYDQAKALAAVVYIRRYGRSGEAWSDELRQAERELAILLGE